MGSSTTHPCWLCVCVACRCVCTAHNLAVCLHRAKGAKPGDSDSRHAAGRAGTGHCSPLAAPCWPLHLPVPGRVMRLCPHPSFPHALQHPLAHRSPRGCPPHARVAAAPMHSWSLPWVPPPAAPSCPTLDFLSSDTSFPSTCPHILFLGKSCQVLSLLPWAHTPWRRHQRCHWLSSVGLAIPSPKPCGVQEDLKRPCTPEYKCSFVHASQ